MLTRRAWLVWTLLVLFVGCTARSPKGMTIGAVGPMTGDQSKQGLDLRNGVELAVIEWNARGGVLGRKIVLQVEDDRHDPKQAVSVAHKLVNSGAAGVVGHWNSSASIPASAVYHAAGTPMITPASTNPQLTEQGFENVFRVCGRDDQQGRVAAVFVSQVLKARTVAILHDKTTYGQGLAEEFQKALAPEVTVVHYGGITQGDRDFRGVLTTVRAKRPALLYFGGIYPEASQLARQAKELGLTAPMMSGDGTIDQQFIEIAGPAAEGTYLTFSPDPAHIPGATQFLDAYHARYGEHGPYSIYAYVAANILLEGIVKAGTTDGRAVSDAIHRLTHQGALGTIRFDAKGDVLDAPYIVWITRGGKFEEFWKPGGPSA